eukprot:CAMPEP_0185033970 /NCGR_PEP_ID=MMETSP1103-20130426/23423_1 /TAXON_ID=36769 /ORGANISM="Paraphysomonas bandaiensis, Strain Caron Lab Isolate" /LENGTH=333 /DNA_ID=CAMNT_0027570433 /DNA_START=136 /DNA_END=1137 /DNA_ORIENTATION=+
MISSSNHHTYESINEMIITIGPQCAGKSTYLNSIPGIQDISIDDMSRTYASVPVRDVLYYNETGCLTDNLSRMVYKKSLLDRIYDLQGSEQIPLMFLFCNEFSPEEFCSCIDGFMSPDDAELMRVAAMNLYNNGYRMVSPIIDIFIPEAIGFSVQQAKSLLASCSQSSVAAVAWGNTNLIAANYKTALQEAFQNKRKVRFVKWGYELPAVDLITLQIRNIHRFIATGRYIHLSVLKDFLRRTSTLYESARKQLEESPVPMKVNSENIDWALARMAGFELENSRYVRPVVSRSNRSSKRANGTQNSRSGRSGRDDGNDVSGNVQRYYPHRGNHT